MHMNMFILQYAIIVLVLPMRMCRYAGGGLARIVGMLAGQASVTFSRTYSTLYDLSHNMFLSHFLITQSSWTRSQLSEVQRAGA